MYTISHRLNKKNFKQRLLIISALWLLLGNFLVVSVYADGPDNQPQAGFDTSPVIGEGLGGGSEGGIADDDTSQEDGANTLASIFSTDVWSGTKLQSGLAIARPFIKIIMVLSVAIVALIGYLFIATTALDLTYITVPISRPLLMRGKEKHSMGRDGGSGMVRTISDAAVDAVEGRGGKGGMSGGGDRGVSSCLMTYISSRTTEFVVFVLFIMFFFTGILGKIVVVLYNLMFSILEGLLSLA